VPGSVTSERFVQFLHELVVSSGCLSHCKAFSIS
jgi:hypothetical protein